MAKKFNNGQTFGEIRQILNDNADDINANKTAVETAQTAADSAMTEAEKLATYDQAGRVQGMKYLQVNSVRALEEVMTLGVLYYYNGKGSPCAIILRQHNFRQSYANNPPYYGIPFLLSGSMVTNAAATKSYLFGWKNTDTANAYVFFAPTHCIAFDCDNMELWMCEQGKANWKQIGGASVGGGSDYTLPVASASTLGGIKVGAGLSITNGVLSVAGGGGVGQSVITLEVATVQEQGLDEALAVKSGQVVTYILPAGQYTGAWYDMALPFQGKELGLTSAAVTVYPNGMKTAIVSGFGDDGEQVFNGTCTYTPATGWALGYNWPQNVASRKVSDASTETGKEVKDTNGK